MIDAYRQVRPGICNVRIVAHNWRYIDVRWSDKGWQNNFQRFPIEQLHKALALAAELRVRAAPLSRPRDASASAPL
jgi:hypothetical protein